MYMYMYMYIPFSDHGILQSSFFRSSAPDHKLSIGKKIVCSERNRRARSLDKEGDWHSLSFPQHTQRKKEYVLYICIVLYIQSCDSCPIHFEDSSE